MEMEIEHYTVSSMIPFLEPELEDSTDEDKSWKLWVMVKEQEKSWS